MPSPIIEEYNRLVPPVEYDVSPEELRRATYIDRQLQSAEPSRQAYIQQAARCMAMYDTRTQWTRWSTSQNRLVPIPKSDKQHRITINHVAPIVDTIATAVTNTQPGWQVTPASSEDEDIQASQASERLLEHLYREEAMATKITEWVKWAEITGIGWAYEYWDPNRGDRIETEGPEGPGPDGSAMHEGVEGEMVPDGYELGGEEGVEGSESMEPKTGGVAFEVVPPLALTWDPGARSKDLRDCRWIAHTALLSIDEVYERWPARAPFVRFDTTVEPDTFGMQVLASIQGGPVGQSAGQAPDRAKVITYFEAPSMRHPCGYWCVKAGVVILEEGDELPAGKLPFACIRYNPVPGRMWGQGLVTRIEELQMTANYQSSKLLQMVALHANPKWAVQEGSVRKSQFTDEPGEIVEFARNSVAPHPIPPVPISPEHRAIAQECISQMYDISGVGEITRGVVPPGISGRAAAIMQEADSARRRSVVQELAEALERLGHIALALYKEHLTVDIIIKVVGRGNRMEAQQFSAGNIRSTDVRISMDSMALRHPTIQNEQTMQAAERGLYGDLADPNNLAKVQKALQLPGVEDATTNTDPEESYALELNHAILAGQPAPVHPWEPHDVHIRALRRLLQSEDMRNAGPAAFEVAERALATRLAYKAAEQQGHPWYARYADPAAMALLSGQGAPAPSPGSGAPASAAPPPTDAYGLPPDMASIEAANAGTSWDPRMQVPPPIPEGLPVGGPGVAGVTTRAALQDIGAEYV